jgi:SAM-dependent methyltransferase
VSKDIHLRTSFNREARLYHETRPRYPQALFDSLIKVTHLQKNARLLEIGPGTGQATEALARRGYLILAVELGPDLAEVAREALRSYENVEVINGAFEEVELPSESFDLVYAATSFHWVNPAARFMKPHALLKERGHLAIIDTHHVSDEAGDRFFFASRPIFEEYRLNDKGDDFHKPRTFDLKPFEFDENLFELVFFKAFPIQVRYNSKEFAKLLGTYSPMLAMNPKSRAGFLKEITDLIENQFGGFLNYHFAMTLAIAKKI